MKNPVDLVTEKVASYCERYGIKTDGRILVGLSGGPDSVTLLHVLLRLGADPCCIHVNHMIRGEDADRDEAFCRDLCGRLGVDFKLFRVNIPELSLKAHKGLEETARDERRRIFAKAAAGSDCRYVALAHNADDRAETYLFNLARGAGMNGLGSIRPIRKEGDIVFVRPLLCLCKKEILGFLSALGESYVTDATNADTEYTRNYIRHELLPGFERINPAYLSNINKAADAAAEADGMIEECAVSFISDRLYIDRGAVLELHPAVEKKVFSLLYGKCGGQSLSETHLSLIHDFAVSTENGKRLSLPGGCDLICENGMLRFIPRTSPLQYDIPLVFGRNDIPGRNSVIFLEYSDDTGASDAYINIYNLVKRIKISSAIIKNGIHVRNRADGDRIVYGNMTHSVKKLLSDKKVPSSLKADHPVVYDGDGLLFVPPGAVRDGIRGDSAVSLTYFEY